MPATPLVSVCLSSYQYADYVAESIEGALAQEGVDLELIAIDDASTDGSWGILQRYAADPRVRLIRHEQNCGFLRTRTEALALSRGEHIVTLDADDVAIDSNALRSQVDVLRSEPSVGLVCADFDLIDERGRRVGRRRVPFRRMTPGREAFRVLLRANRIMHSGTMLRRACVADVGGYDDRYEDCADWDLWLRIASRYDIARVARPLYAYRLHSRNMFRSTDPEERCVLVGRAMTYAPRGLEREGPRALAAAHVTAASIELGSGRWPAVTRHIGLAARQHWPALLSRAIPRGAAKLALRLVVGPTRAVALTRFVQRSVYR